MCLYSHADATEKMKKRLAKAPVTFYKAYKINGAGKVITPFRKNIVKVIDGCVRSDRKSAKLRPSEDGGIISHGIHVMRYKKQGKHLPYSAQSYLDNGDADFIVPVICKAEDFIACGDAGDAVFTKVYINAQQLKSLAEAAEKKF